MKREISEMVNLMVIFSDIRKIVMLCFIDIL